MKQITKIDVLSLALVQAFMTAAIILALGILSIVLGGLFTNMMGSSFPEGSAMMITGGGIIGTIIGMVFGFIGGFIFGAIGALIYNLIVKMVGGVKIELE